MVNDVALPVPPLRPGVATYRLTVPAGVWRAGMNRLELSTSALVRPSDVSDSRDERELGLAVSGLRFTVVGSGN